MKFKKKLFLILSFVMIFLSCQKNNIPEGVLPKEKIIPILVDIHIADANLSVSRLFKKMDDEKMKLYYQSVLDKHKISKEELKMNMAYYVEHGDIYNEIYEEVIISLTKKQEKEKK